MTDGITSRLFFVYGICIALQRTLADDPCQSGNYIGISDGHRSISFVPGPTDSLICDYYTILSGHWYRFASVVGGQLPEHCVDTFHCGTQAPIWMNGFHPTKYGDMVTREVCANFGYPADCCTWSATIDVMRCYDSFNMVDYFVYRLVSPPGCPISYCAGNQIPCSGNSIYNNITQTCEDIYPHFSNVTLLPPVVENDFVVFYCQINSTTASTRSDNGAFFQVDFYFDNVLFPNATTIVPGTQTKIPLQEKWLRGNMGKLLSCGVTSFWIGYRQYGSPYQYSVNEYFVGILLDPGQVVVSENDNAPMSVYLKSTIPITCKTNPYEGRCEITVRVVSPLRLVSAQGSLESGYTQCGYRISRESWNASAGMAFNASEPLQILVRRSPVIHTATTEFIHFQPFPVSVPAIVTAPNGSVLAVYQSIWDGYVVEDIQVEIKQDSRIGTCMSISDPRIITWNQNGYDIINLIGEFVLWRSSSQRVFEVQIRFWRCSDNWFVSCTCGVAVREGNTVLAVDMCGGSPSTSPRPKVTQMSDSADLRGASITRDLTGSSFSINMPSGAYIKMDLHNWGMNVFAYATSEDIGLTSGLCQQFSATTPSYPYGVVDFDTQNDFVEQWRVAPGQSFFDRQPPWVTLTTQDPMYCTCDSNDTVVCDWTENVDPLASLGKPNITVDPLIQKQVLQQPQSGRRRRRAATFGGDSTGSSYTDLVDNGYVVRPFDYGLTPLQTPTAGFAWPTPSGITQQYATDYCEQTLKNASSYAICQKILGVTGVLDPVSRCIQDIQIMDDLSWSQNAVSEMQFQCLTIAMQTTNDSATTVVGTISEQVVKYICPSQCSAHGSCVNGVCKCSNGFVGADCSLLEGQVPDLDYIPNDGLCDVSQRPCLAIRIIGSGFLDSSTLTCRIVPVQYALNYQVIDRDLSAQSNATLISLTEVSCSLPASPVLMSRNNPNSSDGTPIFGMLLSLSNDGLYFSNELFLTIYDSTCIDCTGNRTCLKTNSSCLVNGHCFAPSDANPLNWCEYCDPGRSQSQFVLRPVFEAPAFKTTSPIIKVFAETLNMYLTAEDSNGQQLFYRLLSTTSPSVFVDSTGYLVWKAPTPSSNIVDDLTPITIQVSASNECNATVTASFILRENFCHCQNGGTCLPDPTLPRGQGYYVCLCSADYLGAICEATRDPCQSSAGPSSGPCVYGSCVPSSPRNFTCLCNAGYEGTLCDEAVAPTGMPQNVGLWTAYNPWSACSQPCDYGLSTRQRICQQLPCSGEASQTVACNEFNCPVVAGEVEQGVILVIGNMPVAKFRQAQSDIKAAISSSFNSYCSSNAAYCCKAMANVDQSQIIEPLTDSNDFYFASGYPKMLQTGSYGIKVIAYFDPTYIRLACQHQTSISRKVRTTFLPVTVLQTIMQASEGRIETLFDLTIAKVASPDEFAQSLGQTTAVNSDNRETTIYAVAGSIAALLAVAIVVAIVVAVYVIKRKRRQNQLTEKKSPPSTFVSAPPSPPAKLKQDDPKDHFSVLGTNYPNSKY